jgi:hypothetical protein
MQSTPGAEALGAWRTLAPCRFCQSALIQRDGSCGCCGAPDQETPAFASDEVRATGEALAGFIAGAFLLGLLAGVALALGVL